LGETYIVKAFKLPIGTFGTMMGIGGYGFGRRKGMGRGMGRRYFWLYSENQELIELFDRVAMEYNLTPYQLRQILREIVKKKLKELLDKKDLVREKIKEEAEKGYPDIVKIILSIL